MFYYGGSKVASIIESNESGYKYKVLLEYDGVKMPFVYGTNRKYSVGDEFDD